jgi:antitoxin Phd
MSDRTRKPDKPEPADTSPPWDVEVAGRRFGELVDLAMAAGPQIVTRSGRDTAVVVSIKDWQDLWSRSRPNLKEWLLAPHARSDDLVPPRRQVRRRPPPTLDE